MRILIVEDDTKKYDRVSKCISDFFSNINLDIERSVTFSHATKLIFENKYDLIIIDLLLPRLAEDKGLSDISSEIVTNIQESKFNSNTTVIAISMYDKLVDELARDFHESGILLLNYKENDESWKNALEVCLQRVKIENAFDFIIFCALEGERNAFGNADCTIGEYKTLFGLDCQEISIDHLKGLIVKPPKMGLVDASIICSRCIERFSPRLICMSGICAGFANEVTIGTLVVSERAWEHQAGKWSKGNFKLDHYQSNIDNVISVKLDQYMKGTDFHPIKKEGFLNNKLIGEPLILAPTVSGSAVIASDEKISEIKEQHRKVKALDMEVYGLYRAVELSAQNPIFFSAKTVVDLAGSAKDDEHHMYGATLSARFVVGAIRMLCS